MAERSRGVAGFRLRACLLLVLWPQRAAGTPCRLGELRAVGRDEEKCCPKCSAGTGNHSPCPDIQDHDCKCSRGYSCGDRDCLYCRELPECAEGEELLRLGTVDFTFRCKPCERGTYSSVRNDWCRNWTDCESSGFLTIKQGNRTHNAVCGLPPPEQAPGRSPSLYTTILAVLTAVALFVLILLTFLLHFCIWSLNKEKYSTAESLEQSFPRHLLPPLPSHYREETSSCQFPEEEHGDKTAEEKLCPFHLP